MSDNKRIFQKFFVGEGWDDCFLMPSAAFKVWMRHYSHEQGDKRESYPSLDYLCAKCDLNKETVLKARKWLLANGWLVKIGDKQVNGKFAVPIFRVERGTIPPHTDKPLTEKPCTLKPSTARAGKTVHGKSATESEPSLTRANDEEDKEVRKERKKTPPLASLATATVMPAPAEASAEVLTLALVWLNHTGCEFVPDDYALAQALVDNEDQGYGRVEQVLYNTLCERPKSSGMDWTDFRVFANNYDLNRRKALAWERKMKTKTNGKNSNIEFHSHGCYNNPCYCYLSLSPENQEYWRTLVKYNLCGHVGNKWYLGKSAEEAIAGYPDIAACIQDLFHKQPPDLIAKLRVLIQESTAAVAPRAGFEVEDDENVRYMSGLDEIEQNLEQM